MTLLVVSPHCDDAVLSCGQFLADSRSPVLTIFAGSPADDVLTDYDRGAGFISSEAAMLVRRLEDIEALSLLGSMALHQSFLDLQYAPTRPTAAHLAVIIDECRVNRECDGIVGPLGLQHPDHELVSDACLRLADDGIAVWLYEELPYRVVWPELVEQRKSAVSPAWTMQPDMLGAGDRSLKAKAINRYVSQDVDVPCCLVPERFWRLCGEERTTCG